MYTVSTEIEYLSTSGSFIFTGCSSDAYTSFDWDDS